jgi:hypothetical protein
VTDAITSSVVRTALSTALGWVPNMYRWIVDGRCGSRVPMAKAARIAYEQGRQTGSVYAMAAERMGTGKSPEDVLDWVATYMAKDSKIWGKRPPSTKYELIDALQAKYANFTDGATVLRLRDESHSVFTDLMIARNDLRRVIAEFREGLKTDTPI